MPIWVAALLGGLVQACGTLVGRVLVSLGIGYVTFTGLDTSLAWARDQAISAMGAVGGTAVGVMGVLQVGTCVSIVCSALAARMLLDGISSGVLSKMVVKA